MDVRDRRGGRAPMHVVSRRDPPGGPAGSDLSRPDIRRSGAPAPEGAPAGIPAEPISYAELERRLEDIDIPDRALRPYFTGDPAASQPFAPVVQIDPATVVLDRTARFRVEGAFAMDWANRIARRRRQERFARRRARGERRPVLVAEGDSWFQFPFLLDDIVDQLDANYHVWCVSAAGDTLAGMIEAAPEYVEALAGQAELPNVLLFSGAGNDLVGEDTDGTSVLFGVLRDFEPGRPAAWYVDTDAFAERLAFIERAYRTLLGTVGQAFGGRVAVVLHGYDHAIPGGPGDPRRPLWAANDAWIGAPLTRRGIMDPALRRAIVRTMIDHLNELQRRLCGGGAAGGTFAHAWHVDVRGTLPRVADWADELHPTDAGFARAARRFDRVLAHLINREEATMANGERSAGRKSEAVRTERAAGSAINATLLGDIVASRVADAVAAALQPLIDRLPPPGAGDTASARTLQRHAAGPSAGETAGAIREERTPAAGGRGRAGDSRPEGGRASIRAATEPAGPRDLGADAGGPDVPFVAEVTTEGRLFADLGAELPVNDPAAMIRGFRALEVAVGREILANAALLDVLARRRRAVARITAEGVDYQGRDGRWTGTGFLVAPNLLLTNHHVLNSIAVATTARAEFDYEVTADDLLAGADGALAKKRFPLDPARLFVTSPVDGGLDFTFVWIERAAAEEFGAIPLERASFSVGRGEQAYVIHHPRGEPKQVSLDDTDVLNVQSTVIHYASDTDYGSSGAPVLDRRGRLIALHHARDQRRLDLPDGGTTTIVNEGIKIGAIAIDLENRQKQGSADAQMAAEVLGVVRGSDSLTGYFGGLGRSVGSGSGVERVVDTYRGTDQDVDIGFWNIEWLANRWRDKAKLQGAARVIADLNLDVWGLSEVSPAAVRALVAEIKERFRETYDCAFSEPDAPEGRQTTAVIWKRATLRGERVAWPSAVEPLFRLDSRDPQAREEAVHGRIFDRYPGLFRFETRSDRRGGGDAEPGFDFHLVPLHLKAMAEGSLRRRLASRILARASKALIEETGDTDLILGGDMNAPLASGDLDALRDDFVAMAAEDEQNGGFTYLKSPKSLIDNIFLSSNLTRTVDSDDFFIVAKERTIDEFVKRVSDHRPALLRISLGLRTREAAVADTPTDLDEIIDSLLGDRPEPPVPLRRAG